MTNSCDQRHHVVLIRQCEIRISTPTHTAHGFFAAVFCSSLASYLGREVKVAAGGAPAVEQCPSARHTACRRLAWQCRPCRRRWCPLTVHYRACWCHRRSHLHERLPGHPQGPIRACRSGPWNIRKVSKRNGRQWLPPAALLPLLVELPAPFGPWPRPLRSAGQCLHRREWLHRCPWWHSDPFRLQWLVQRKLLRRSLLWGLAPSFAFGQPMMPTVPFRQVSPGAPSPINSPQCPSSPQAMVQFRHPSPAPTYMPGPAPSSSHAPPAVAPVAPHVAPPVAHVAVAPVAPVAPAAVAQVPVSARPQGQAPPVQCQVQVPSVPSAPWPSWESEETVPQNMSASARTIVPPQAPTSSPYVAPQAWQWGGNGASLRAAKSRLAID
eukprot:s569_g36.t1